MADTAVPTNTDVELEIMLLEESLNADSPKCGTLDCENDAAHTVSCPCGQSTEYLCQPCLNHFKNMHGKRFLGILKFKSNCTFTNCGHVVPLHKCIIRPI